MELRPIFDVCAREMGYEGEGTTRVAWWHQEGTGTQLRATLEGIFGESRRSLRIERNIQKGPGVKIGGRRLGSWTLWDGDGILPGGRMTPCGGWRCLDGDR